MDEMVNPMRGLGDTMTEQMVVGKVLRSLGPKFDNIVLAIKVTKDLTKLTL